MALIFIASGYSASSATRALVIGVDDYAYLTKLDGAVNDARDLADALETSGVAEVTLLLDREASRDRVLQVWTDMIDISAPGDVVFVSYAGHGGQEAVPKGTGGEADALDETLLLAAFTPEGAGTYERIRDDEIATIIRRRSDVTVILVFDACHSGGLTRSVDPRAAPAKVRFSSYRVGKDDRLPPPPQPTQRGDDLPANIAFFGAVQENELAPEVRIDGQMRGALSWSVAKALRGEADFDENGKVTRQELERSVSRSVETRMAGRQHPRLEFGMPRGATLWNSGASASQALPPLPEVSVFFHDLGDGTLESFSAELVGTTLAARDTADLIIDMSEGDVITRLGDLIASEVSTGEDLQAVIDRTRLLSWVGAAASKGPIEMATLPSDKRFAIGEQLSLEILPFALPSLTVINLAPEGTIQFLYPVFAEDPRKIVPGEAFGFELEASPPVGSNALIAIATEEPLDELHEALHLQDGKREPLSLYQALSNALTGQRFEFGSRSVFTGSR